MKITYKTEIVVGGLKHIMTTTAHKSLIDDAHKKHIELLGFDSRQEHGDGSNGDGYIPQATMGMSVNGIG